MNASLLAANRARTLAHIRALTHLGRDVGALFGHGRVRRRARAPRALQPDALRLEYYKAIRDAVCVPAKRVVDKLIVPALPRLVRAGDARRGDRMDAEIYGPDVAALIAQAQAEFAASVQPSALIAIPKRFAKKTSDFQRKQLTKQIKAVIGVDLFTSDARLSGLVDNFASDNVALIKTVSAKYFSDVETTVTSAMRSGDRADVIADDLTARYGVSESNALRIGRDQIGKLNGEINKARQEDLGVDGFVWRTMNDNRVRDEHAALEGQSFTWDDPPEEGIPGEPIMCRCYAEPDMSALLAGLD